MMMTVTMTTTTTTTTTPSPAPSREILGILMHLLLGLLRTLGLGGTPELLRTVLALLACKAIVLVWVLLYYPAIGAEGETYAAVG